VHVVEVDFKQGTHFADENFRREMDCALPVSGLSHPSHRAVLSLEALEFQSVQKKRSRVWKERTIELKKSKLA
jgi:hypothetical protein